MLNDRSDSLENEFLCKQSGQILSGHFDGMFYIIGLLNSGLGVV